MSPSSSSSSYSPFWNHQKPSGWVAMCFTMSPSLYFPFSPSISTWLIGDALALHDRVRHDPTRPSCAVTAATVTVAE